MARRQAAPKPEELITKLEERLDTFRDDVTARLDLQLRHKQNVSDIIKAVSFSTGYRLLVREDFAFFLWTTR